MIKTIFLLLTFIVSVTGCSIKPAKIVYMEQEKANKMNVYSVIKQNELDTLYPPQNSSAVSSQFDLVGALVGAAIDASANSKSATTAEENLAGIRNELIDLDFNKVFEEEIIKKLENNV